MELVRKQAGGRWWHCWHWVGILWLVGGAQLHHAAAQPLAWSPHRAVTDPPMRSLAELAADATPPMASSGVLMRNADTADGRPPFVLVDHFGQVQRYVEPTPGVNLADYVGQQVTVRSDTGTTLLASQLELPTAPASDHGVALAAHEAPHRPAPDGGRMPTHRTAQVQPIVIDGYGQATGPAACNCPHCTAQRAGGGWPAPFGGARGTGLLAPGYSTDGSPFACSGPSCSRGSRGRVYGRAEYLRWWFDGMQTPPLVTTSPDGTPQAQAGVLGQEGTSVLFGDGTILDDSRNGVRLLVGAWVNDYQDIAVEADVLYFETASTSFSRVGTAGSPILARPFFNMVPLDSEGEVLPPAEDAQLISFPNLIEGRVSVHARSELSGAGLRLRGAVCCGELGGSVPHSDPCAPVVAPWGTSRIDVIGGYRYLQLDERILIREQLTSLLSTDPGTFDIHDRFDTANEFHGGDIGFVWEWETQRWSLELLTKMAIGNTNQRVNIRGETTVSDGGASFTDTGGLLALRSNIGAYERNVFTVIPELGVTAGYKVTPRLRVTAGYTLLYWSRVARPGDHISLDVNPNLLPPEVEPVVGPERPDFTWKDTALLAHGLNLGLDYRF